MKFRRSGESPDKAAPGQSARRSRLLAVMLAVMLAASACSTSDAGETEEDTASEPEAVEETTASTTSASAESDVDVADVAIEFEPCGDGAECGFLDVPLDYDNPDGPTVPIHVTRHQARGERIGPLFMNPGGPGAALEEMIKGFARLGFTPLSEVFDFVGVDPRGTGKSGQISCNSNWEEDFDRWLTPEDGLADDIEAAIDDFELMATECEAEHGVDFLASITTENAARDIESVRVALGGEPMTYLGYSYGTAIGSVYATLFPDELRSMVLDSAVPIGIGELDAEGNAERVDETFRRLDRSCDLWDECPVGDIGLLTALEQLEDTLERDGSVGDLQPVTAFAAINSMVYVPLTMTFVLGAVASAIDGDGAELHRIGLDFLRADPEGGYLEFGGSNQAIICADGFRLAASDSAELLEQAEATVGFEFGGPNWGVPCDLWPTEGGGVPIVDYTGDAPILVFGTTDDPITPLAWSAALAEDLGPNATLYTQVESAHGPLFRSGDACIDGHALDFLIDGVVPEVGIECPLRGLIGIGLTSDPVVIDRVTPGSPSDLAGVLIGDQIVEWNGLPVQFQEDITDGPAGEEVQLVVERDGEQIELSLVRGTPIWELWRTVETDS